MSSTNATRSSRIGPPRLHMPLQVQRQLFPQEEAVGSQPGLRVQPKPKSVTKSNARQTTALHTVATRRGMRIKMPQTVPNWTSRSRPARDHPELIASLNAIIAR